MATPCDFIPDECTALLIKACLLRKRCLLNKFKFKGLKVGAGGEASGGLTLMQGKLRATLDEGYICLVEKLQKAFEAAGCPFPQTLVDNALPQPPDLSSCTSALKETKDSITAGKDNPLSFLEPIVTITLDANDLPIRIVTDGT